MNTLTDKFYLGGWLLVLVLHQLQAGPANVPETDRPTHAASQFLAAYNSHDVTAMLSLVHPEVRYMYINNDSIYIETKDKAALAKFLPEFFQNRPEARSILLSSQQHGPFINQVEQAIWTDKSGQVKAQCSLSVYEIKDHLIVNIWYHNAYECELKQLD